MLSKLLTACIGLVCCSPANWGENNKKSIFMNLLSRNSSVCDLSKCLFNHSLCINFFFFLLNVQYLHFTVHIMLSLKMQRNVLGLDILLKKLKQLHAYSLSHAFIYGNICDSWSLWSFVENVYPMKLTCNITIYWFKWVHILHILISFEWRCAKLIWDTHMGLSKSAMKLTITDIQPRKKWN